MTALNPAIIPFLVMGCELSDVVLQLELLGGGILRRVLLVHGDEPIGILHKGVGVHKHF
jgi:hypothetical protein